MPKYHRKAGIWRTHRAPDVRVWSEQLWSWKQEFCLNTPYCTHTVFDDWFVLFLTRLTAHIVFAVLSVLSDNILILCWTLIFFSELTPFCRVCGWISQSSWVLDSSFFLPSLMSRLAHASPLMITLISVSLIVFHPHVFSCALVHTVQVSCWDTGGCAARYKVETLLKVPLIALLLRLEVEFIYIWILWCFLLISMSLIPHYALLSISCKQRLHLMWRECNPCKSWRTIECVVKTLIALIASLFGRFVL